jgi:2C-methyl-D-erythritol 2,4-cyclodiphosphate synthase
LKQLLTLLVCVLGRVLLLLQVKKMKEAGYVLGNLDATIIAQKPKLSPHKVNFT